MAKKNKKFLKQKIQNILKETEQHSQNTSHTYSPVSSSVPSSQRLTSSNSLSLISDPDILRKDLIRLSIQTGIILILIVITVILDLKTPWIKKFADIVYLWSKLGS